MIPINYWFLKKVIATQYSLINDEMEVINYCVLNVKCKGNLILYVFVHSHHKLLSFLNRNG